MYRAFRAPTINELYRTFRVGNVLTLNNPYLNAERLTGAEAGVNVTALDRKNTLVAKQRSLKNLEAQQRAVLADYQKKLVLNGKTLDGWDSDVVVQAAMRLLYYFPKEFAPVIAARLRALDVADAGDDFDKWMRREVKNGVTTTDFIEAVAWCEETVVREALADVVRRSNDASVKAAASRKGKR